MKMKISNNAVVRALAVSLVMLISNGVLAQTYRSGQHVEPAFEGWRPNEDGTFNLSLIHISEPTRPY